MRFFTLLPKMKVKLLDRDVLIASGYEDNDEPEDFLNLMAGKEVTIEEKIQYDIYTCKEFPDVAIYKVFIESIVSADLTVKEMGIVYGISVSTVNRAFTSDFKKLKSIMNKEETIMEYINE